MAKTIVEYTEKLNEVFFKDGNVATVEDTSTASKAYAVGDLVIVAAVMYRVTAAVAHGGTLISGVNITQTTVEELLANKVDKVAGKGLSSNDFTTTEKNKLAGLSNYDDTDVRNLIAGKQNQLTFDTTPTASSANPVTSGGVKSALDGKQATISGGASTIASSNLTASRALVSNSNGKVAVSEVTSTELGYLDGVTSNVQTQLNGKQATITGAASSVTGSNLTSSRAVITNSSGKLAASSITSTKLGYLTDVTSNIQAQLNKKWTFSTELTLGTNSEIHEQGDTVAQGGLTVGQALQLPDTGEIICGKYSKDASNAYLVVGNGTSDSNKKNALEVYADGRVNVPGNLTVNDGNTFALNNLRCLYREALICNYNTTYTIMNIDWGLDGCTIVNWNPVYGVASYGLWIIAGSYINSNMLPILQHNCEISNTNNVLKFKYTYQYDDSGVLSVYRL